MATLSRSTRRTGSDVQLVELPPPSARPKRPARRSKPVEDKPAADVDVLTAEEEYLLKVFRRYSKNGNTAASPATAAALGSQKLPQAGNSRRSPSPPAPKTSPPFPGMKSAADKASSDGTPGGAAGAMATDTVSRAKMILEKKRKAAAGLGLSRASSAASSGASGLRKAKITKVAGTPSSSALDPVKYPASGLLLREEFRTFVEVEDAGGERVYEPVEPLVRPLKNFGIADGSDGGGKKQQLYETLVMRVTVPAHSQSWGINICPKDHKGFEDIVFHFNPRRRFVAMNNRDANMWGTQEKYMLTRWPDMFNVSINVAVQIDRAGFHIAVDGKYCASFTHRTKLPPSGDELTLQVMTKDDYDTNLGLVVHEIWWGHKDTMPGLPGGVVASTRHNEVVDLHASNLPDMPTEQQQDAVRKRLMDMFQPFGAIQVRVIHRDTKNFGFIKFRQPSEATTAMEELNGAKVMGQTMRLNKAAAR